MDNDNGGSLRVSPIDAPLGAVIEGVDLSRPVASDAAKMIERALADHGVVVFRNQDVGEEAQAAFSVALGTDFLPAEHLIRQTQSEEVTAPVKRSFVDVVMGGNGSIYFLNGPGFYDPVDGPPQSDPFESWHADLTYMPTPLVYTFLYALEVPERGGQTQFSSLYSAYDALSDADKAAFESLHAMHHSKVLWNGPPVTRRLVRKHPVNGRKALTVNRYAKSIWELPQAEGEALVARLMEHATDDRFVYTHEWQKGDLVVWDNRCTMHRRMPIDHTCRRIMRRTCSGPDFLASCW